MEVKEFDHRNPENPDQLADYLKNQPDKEQAIVVREPNAAALLAPQNDQLMSKRRVLGFKPALRLEWREQDGQYQTQQRDHGPPTLGDSFG